MLRLCCLLFILLVSACGGGGGGGDDTPPPPIQFDGDTLSVPARYEDAPSASGSINLTISSAVTYYSLESAVAQPSWLTFSLSGTSSTSAKITATVLASAPIGDYSQKFTFIVFDSSGAKLGSQSFTVRYKILGRFRVVAASSLDLELPFGMTTSPTIALSTTGQGMTWQATSRQGLIKLSSSSGTTGQVVQATPDVATFPVGSYTDQIVFTASDGQVVTLPVTLTIRKSTLVPSSSAVSLSATPAISQLTGKINIRNNLGLETGWIASSDQSWLSVTSSGSTSASDPGLTITANPASLPMNAISYANITVAGSDPNKVFPTTIQVAIWRGDTSLAAITRLPISYLTKIVADPVRPLVYAHNGASSIDVYNVHTASKVATITGVATALGEMAVSRNGKNLYAIDIANASVSVIDLSSLVKTRSWILKNPVSRDTSILSVSPNGTEIILIGDLGYSGGTAYLASNGQYLMNTPINGTMSASADGSVVYSQERGLSPSFLRGYKLAYKETGSGTLVISRISGYTAGSGSNGADVAVSPDGLTVLTASGTPYKCSRFNGATNIEATPLPGGEPYPNNVEVSNDGRLICGVSGLYSTADFWVHSANGTLLKSYKIAGYAKATQDRQMVVSSDSLVVVVLTTDPYLVFVPIGK